MVGKSNPSKVHVTQEQLRLARLMQETSLAEKDKAKYQAALKQVMDLTKCNQDIAVIALYDHGNNVEEAVMAVLEQGNQPDVWNENKSRKTKKPEEKKEKTDKKEDRFNDRTRDTGGQRGRDLASAHGQVGERGRGRQEHNDDRQARTNLENTSRSANHQRVVMEPAIISANSTSQMVTSISHAQPEEGRTWSSIVKSLPPKVELNESLVDAKTNVLNSLADDEFSADFKGLTFTNKQFQDHQISKEQLNSLIANGKAAQQASNEVISNSSSPMEIENMPSTTIVASPQVDHDKTLCSLTNMLKKDIGLPISISTTTGSTEHCGLKIAQSVSEDSLLENKESPVVFLDQNFRSDWHEERQESDNNFSFGEIQGTVEFVDERENEMTGILSRDDVAISFDPYYHQLNSMSSGIASGCTTSAVPTPSPENFGFTSLGTVVDIPPTNFPLAVNEEIKPNFVQAQMSKFTLVSGPSIDFYEQPSTQGYVTTGINSSQSSEIVGASVLDMNNLAPPGLSNLVSQTSQLSCLQQQQQQQQANMLQQQQLMALFCQNGYPYFQSSGMDSQQAAEMINSNVSNVSNFVPTCFQNRNTQSVQVPMLQPQYQPAQNVQMTKMLQGYPYYPLDNKQYARVTPAQAMAFSNFVPQQMSNFANPGHQQYGSGIASEQMTRKQLIPATAYSAIPSKTATNSLFAQNPSQHQEYNNQNAQMSTFPNQNYNN